MSDPKIPEKIRNQMTPSRASQVRAVWKLKLRREAILEEALSKPSRAPWLRPVIASSVSLILVAFISFGLLQPKSQVTELAAEGNWAAEELAMSVEFFEWMDFRNINQTSSGG